MALPIMATPTLKGEEAVRFYEELKENERRGISDEEIRRGTEIFNAVMKKNPEMRGLFGGVAI
jgi:hypothetical protein